MASLPPSEALTDFDPGVLTRAMTGVSNPHLAPAAHGASFLHALNRKMGEANNRNPIADWWENEGTGLMGEIVAGNLYSDQIGDVQMRRLAEGVTRLVYSNEEDLKGLAAEVYHRIGDDRMRAHMDYIDPFVRSVIPDREEPAWWRKALNGLFNSGTDVIEAGWQYIAAPIIGNLSPASRKDNGLWVSREEMDRDGDGRVAGFEAFFGRNADSGAGEGAGDRVRDRV